jgi:L-proline amide hydrolase
VPALIVSGRHDEAGLPLQAELLNGLRTAELTIFGDSSHMPHWEERDRYMQVVGSWLDGHDTPVNRHACRLTGCVKETHGDGHD